ncbi:MAG: hypothetical protein C0402_08135 [Thermodesulfovibrio sp.]|nr:hypothetical protein [Thermodesulfovibrio sp.]
MKRYFLAVIALLLLPVMLAGCGCGGSDLSLVSIAVTPETQTLAMGATQQYTATGTFSDSTTQDLTKLVTWSSSQQTAATISNATGTEGRASGIFTGATTITATSGSISGTAALTVVPNLVSLVVTPQTQTLAAGTAQQFTATGTYSDDTTLDLTEIVTWSSLTEAVATISNTAGTRGRATAVAAGVTTVAATSGQLSDTAILTVTVPPPPPPPPPSVTLVSIKVTPADLLASFSTTIQYTATGTYSDGSTRNITELAAWSSSRPEIATISNTPGTKGLALTDHLVGLTIITAVLDNISGTTTLFDP